LGSSYDVDEARSRRIQTLIYEVCACFDNVEVESKEKEEERISIEIIVRFEN